MALTSAEGKRGFFVGLHQYFHELMSLRFDRFSVSRPQSNLLTVGRRRLNFDQAVCTRKAETEMLHDSSLSLAQKLEAE